jgi:hypothetical protein
MTAEGHREPAGAFLPTRQGHGLGGYHLRVRWLRALYVSNGLAVGALYGFVPVLLQSKGSARR